MVPGGSFYSPAVIRVVDIHPAVCFMRTLDRQGHNQILILVSISGTHVATGILPLPQCKTAPAGCECSSTGPQTLSGTEL